MARKEIETATRGRFFQPIITIYICSSESSKYGECRYSHSCMPCECQQAPQVCVDILRISDFYNNISIKEFQQFYKHLKYLNQQQLYYIAFIFSNKYLQRNILLQQQLNYRIIKSNNRFFGTSYAKTITWITTKFCTRTVLSILFSFQMKKKEN